MFFRDPWDALMHPWVLLWGLLREAWETPGSAWKPPSGFLAPPWAVLKIIKINCFLLFFRLWSLLGAILVVRIVSETVPGASGKVLWDNM